VRLDHGEKRRLLQVQQLRHDERLRVKRTPRRHEEHEVTL
jgi:hypothetical protein